MTNEEPTTKVVTSPNRRRNPAGEIGDTAHMGDTTGVHNGRTNIINQLIVDKFAAIVN